MNRLIWLMIAAAFVGVGCNEPHCGAGTVARQQPDGSLDCVPADQAGAATPCDDADGGTSTISGGTCVSRVMCDPATTRFDPVSGLCVASGAAPTCVCPATDASHICVSGSLFDLVGNSASMKNVRYAAYDPLQFLSNPNVAPLAEDTNAKGCYVFAGVKPPSTGLLAIVVKDPAGTTPAELEQAAVGATVVGGQSYKVDVFFLAAATVQSWSSSAGIDYDAQGGYLGLFFGEPAPGLTQLGYDEKTPIAGAVLQANGAPAPQLKFLGPTRGGLDPALSVTGMIGAAITPAPSGVNTYSGSGGQCNGTACAWEKHLGGGVAHAIFIERFHDCTSTPSAPTCM